MLAHPPLIPNDNRWEFSGVLTGIADDNQRQRIKIFQVGDFFILDSKNRYLNILCIIRQDGT